MAPISGHTDYNFDTTFLNQEMSFLSKKALKVFLQPLINYLE